MAPEECCSGMSRWAVHRVTAVNASVLSAGSSLNCQLLLTPWHWPERARGKGAQRESQWSRVPLGTCRMTNLLVQGTTVKSGQIYVRCWRLHAGRVWTRELGWPAERFSLAVTFFPHYCIHKHHHHPSEIVSHLRWPLTSFSVFGFHPCGLQSLPFSPFCNKTCDEKLYSTWQLSWHYILRLAILVYHRDQQGKI